jgi:uncharacterized protein (UPF0305 family)
LLLLKNEADSISPEYLMKAKEYGDKHIQDPPGSIQYIIHHIAKYNIGIFSELRNRNYEDTLEEIDHEKLEEFILRINQYMDEKAPNQTDLKEYIRIISTYLTFIAKKPLHPPRMIVDGNKKIFKKGDNYFCPMKSKYILEAMSLCKYCVCKKIN